MREIVSIPYWAAIGLVTLFCFYASVLANLPLYLLLIPIALALFGVWCFGLRSSGAFLIAFGVYPALLISVAILGQIANSDWSCSEVAFDGIGNPNGGDSGCTTISIDLIMTALVFWAMTLLGAALLYSLTQRDRTRPDTHELRSSIAKVVTSLLLVIGGVALSITEAPPPSPSPPERAGLPPNGLPVSCPEGEEDRGYFNGFGDDTTPTLQMSSAGWRYVYNSSGAGAFDMQILDENGNALPSSSESGVAGDKGRSSWLEAGGTFSVNVNAEETVGHTVLICENTDPSGRNKGTIN